MQPRIRRGHAQDAAELASLRWASRDESERAHEAFDTFAPRFVGWLQQALLSGDWHVAVACAGPRIVGCMFLRRVDTVPVPGIRERAWGYVTHAYVTPEWRNRGIGRAMLRQLIEDARALGLVELHTWPSQGAISLYTRAGFRSPEMQRASQPPDEPSYVLPLA
jgi:ribosomal protein S18 acetylase RimI-like enzyme